MRELYGQRTRSSNEGLVESATIQDGLGPNLASGCAVLTKTVYTLAGDNALVSFRGENACLDHAAKEAIGLSDLWRRFSMHKTVERQRPRRQDGVWQHDQAAHRLPRLGRSRKPIAGLVVLSIVAMLLMAALDSRPASASDFRVLSPTASDFPQHVDWVTVCFVTKRAPDDPIIFPGQPGKSHDHTFSGSLAINPDSTADELLASPTNCRNTGDRSSYWMPTLLVNGQARLPYQVRAYYRAGTHDTTQLHAIPFGLKLVAGNAMATSPQSCTDSGVPVPHRGQRCDRQEASASAAMRIGSTF